MYYFFQGRPRTFGRTRAASKHEEPEPGEIVSRAAEETEVEAGEPDVEAGEDIADQEEADPSWEPSYVPDVLDAPEDDDVIEEVIKVPHKKGQKRKAVTLIVPVIREKKKRGRKPNPG